MGFEKLQRKATGVAFVLGPLFILAAAVVFVLGINVTPDGVGSVTEGVLGVYGFILFIVVFLELARLLGQSFPRFGITCAVLGLLGMACGVTAMADRVNRGVLVAAGVDGSTYQTIMATETGALIAIGLICMLGPLTSILLGIGFLRAKTVPPWAAVALIAAGVCFVGGQATETEFGLNVLYPAAAALWAIALVPMGLRYIRGTEAPHAAGTP